MGVPSSDSVPSSLSMTSISRVCWGQSATAVVSIDHQLPFLVQRVAHGRMRFTCEWPDR